MLRKTLAIASVLSGVLIILILSFTTPTSIGPFGILAFFFLLYIVFLEIFTLIITAVSSFLVFITKGRTLKRPFSRISSRRAYYYSSILALTPILLVAYLSFGNLRLIDIMLIVFFTGIACFLVSKRR